MILDMGYQITLYGDQQVSWFEARPPFSEADLQILAEDPRTHGLRHSLVDDSGATHFTLDAEGCSSSYDAFNRVERRADMTASVLRQAGVECSVRNQSGHFGRRSY